MKFDSLITQLRDLDSSLKSHVTQSANIGLTLRNWLVGAYIVEFEQNGEDRAEYGENLIQEVALKLQIRGLATTVLRHCRTLYFSYPEIRQTVSGESGNTLKINGVEIRQTLSGELNKQITQTVSAKFQRPDFAPEATDLFKKLSFSHFIELLRLDDPLQRAFYEIECIKSGWSVRELKRQIGSLLFERLGLSTDKEKLLRLTASESKETQPVDIIKDPYIFEFLGLTPKEALSRAR